MIVKLFNKSYELNYKYIKEAKHLISSYLNKVDDITEKNKLPDFFTAQIVMMYIVSGAILQDFDIETYESMFINPRDIQEADTKDTDIKE